VKSDGKPDAGIGLSDLMSGDRNGVLAIGPKLSAHLSTLPYWKE
jgi:hypothetical protein